MKTINKTRVLDKHEHNGWLERLLLLFTCGVVLIFLALWIDTPLSAQPLPTLLIASSDYYGTGLSAISPVPFLVVNRRQA